MFEGKHILIIVENLPLPFDRRVWQEANALKEQGAEISIICPKMDGYKGSYEYLNGIHIYRHPLPFEGTNAITYLLEYTISLFWEIFLAIKIFSKKKFHVIHGCNPPDLIFIVALLFKIAGVKYVFDHHDINPELYESKFKKRGFFYKLMITLERLTFMTADYSIATNESFKKIAIERGKMKSENVSIVRSGPNIKRFTPSDGVIDYKKGKKFLIGYIGVIGEQDGLDKLMEILLYLKNKNIDFHTAIIGSGTELGKVKVIARKIGVEDVIDFYGRMSDDKIINDILNTCDVCVNPDIPVPYNNLITTNKVMEYMSLKKPIVQFDLMEGRFSAGASSLYAENSVEDFGEKIISLLGDPEARKTMGEIGYQRIVNELSWDYEKVKLIGLYKKVLKIS